MQPKDFSGRAYFPGTEDHPFHTINTLDKYTAILPAIVYPFLFGGLLYLITYDWVRAIFYFGFILTDLLILSLLPKLKISFGPPTLPMIFLAVLRFPFMLLGLPCVIIFQTIGSLMVIYGFTIEPQSPKVERYSVTKRQSGETGAIKIVHISDLHMEYLTPNNERVITKINELEPDLILFTGDFFNLSNQHDEQTNHDIVHFFNQLPPSSKIIAVTGSPAVDTSESLDWVLPQTTIRLLEDEMDTIEIRGKKINLYGLSCSHRPAIDESKLDSLMQQAPPVGDANILLYHSPDLAPELSGFKIDLQLSGHTHGGQVQIPFVGPIFAASLYGLAFTNGHYLVNDQLNLIVSRGLGLEGSAAPRIRFFSPPEIGFITLEFLSDNVQ
ncbi:MAG: metallophosphoesterase [Anaerolineaceae bacterium]|nr:metallophosphoesterase [Anaerolineaceae bacterium]